MPKKKDAEFTLKSRRIDGGVTLEQFRCDDLADDAKALPVDAFDFLWEDYPTEIQRQVADYGAVKICADRTSGNSQDADRLDRVREYSERWKAGEWQKEMERGAPVVGVEMEALSTLKGCTIPEAQIAWNGLTDVQKDKIRGRDDFRTCLEAAKARRAAKSAVDLSDLVA